MEIYDSPFVLIGGGAPDSFEWDFMDRSDTELGVLYFYAPPFVWVWAEFSVFEFRGWPVPRLGFSVFAILICAIP